MQFQRGTERRVWGLPWFHIFYFKSWRRERGAEPGGGQGRATRDKGKSEIEQIQTGRGVGGGEHSWLASQIKFKIKGRRRVWVAFKRGQGEGRRRAIFLYQTKPKFKKAFYILNIHNKVTSSQCDSRFIYKEPSTGCFSRHSSLWGEKPPSLLPSVAVARPRGSEVPAAGAEPSRTPLRAPPRPAAGGPGWKGRCGDSRSSRRGDRSRGPSGAARVAQPRVSVALSMQWFSTSFLPSDQRPVSLSLAPPRPPQLPG